LTTLHPGATAEAHALCGIPFQADLFVMAESSRALIFEVTEGSD